MFNEQSTSRLAFEYVEREGGIMSYTKLIKLLYLTDRKLLDENEAPLTGDTYVAMSLGPVLSLTYNLIKASDSFESDDYGTTSSDSEWGRLFRLMNEYHLEIQNARPKETLNPVQEKVINKTWDKFQEFTWQDMVEYTHNNCSEWRKVFIGKGVRVANISLGDIFDALAKSADERKEIIEKMDSPIYTT